MKELYNTAPKGIKVWLGSAIRANSQHIVSSNLS